MQISAKIQSGFSYPDLDTKVLKKGLRSVGNEVRKEARKLIARKAVSEAGGFPGKDTGAMQNSIRAKVSRTGFSVAVYPTKTEKMPVYYPAFVVYGHRAPHTETKDQARKHKKRGGVKVAAPRKNFIYEAANGKAEAFAKEMERVMPQALRIVSK